MSLIKAITAGFRAVSAFGSYCPGWERDLAMIQYNPESLEQAERIGAVPQGTLAYATEIIELKIQGIAVAKPRYDWARRIPYRSYDTDRTKGVIIHNALLDLVALNSAHPELSLEQLYAALQEKYWK